MRKYFFILLLIPALLLTGCSDSGNDAPAPPQPGQKYTISQVDIVNGEVTITVGNQPVTEAASGQTVTMTATGNTGYGFVKWTITPGNVSLAPNANASTVTFIMPAENVAVSAEFDERYVPSYILGVTAGANGSVEPSGRSNVEMGTSVEITATPNPGSGYEFYRWVVVRGNLPLDGDEAKANPLIFDMPAGDIDIRAEFTRGGGPGDDTSDVLPQITDPVLKDYCRRQFDTDRNGLLSETEAAAVTEIDLAREQSGENGVASLNGIRSFPALRRLSLAYNSLNSADLSHNDALTYLDLSHNNLTTITLPENSALDSLDCSYNLLSGIDVSNDTALTYLNCSVNPFETGLNVANNTALVSLNCASINLAELNLSTNTALAYLDCSSVEGEGPLQLFYRNRLTSLVLENNTALKTLDVSYNTLLAELDLSNNMALETIDIILNQGLEELDLSNHTALKSVNMVITSSLRVVDLSGCIALTEVYCSGNNITELNVTNATALYYLRCDGNNLTTLDASDMTTDASVATGYVLHCGNQKSGNLTLTLREEQKTVWESDFAGLAVNSNVTLAN